MASCPHGAMHTSSLCLRTSYSCAQAHLRSPFFPFRFLYVQQEEIHVGLGTLVRKTRDERAYGFLHSLSWPGSRRSASMPG